LWGGGGGFFSPKPPPHPPRGPPPPAAGVAAYALDPEAAGRLWAMSEQMNR